MNLQLSELTVLVTGGTAGIGEAIVKRFAQEGANVIFAPVRKVMLIVC